MTSDVPPQTPPTEASLAASDLGRAPRSLFSTDQKVFVGVALAGLLITASVTTISIVHRRQEAAQAKEILTPAATKLLQTPQRTLTDRTGRTVTRADFDGKFLVVNFVFTGCSLSCLAVNHRMAEIQRSVAAHDDVRLVSLTVDPDSDTPERLAKFAAQFGANTNRWLFLTGEKRVLHPLLEKSFLVERDQRLLGFVPGGFAHTDRIAVMDSQGRLRAVINGLKTTAPREVLEVLAQLRAEFQAP